MTMLGPAGEFAGKNHPWSVIAHSLAPSLNMECVICLFSHVWKGDEKPALPISQGDLEVQYHVKIALWKLSGALQELTE